MANQLTYPLRVALLRGSLIVAIGLGGGVTLTPGISVAESSKVAPTAGNAGPEVTNSSTEATIGLAKHLQKIGAKMYGAYWCPHCHHQKDAFGKEAAQLVPYIECDPKGVKPQTEMCKAANVQGFPTWEIKGKLYSGNQPLETLAQASGYTAHRSFDLK
jgi:hypothetical protein